MPKGERTDGWHSRGYLPHFEHEEVCQFVTFGLRDAFPKETLLRMNEDLKLLPDNERSHYRRRTLERVLDQGHGERLFDRPELASLVEDSIRFFHNEKYSLEAWVVMPNHVHVLFECHPGHSLSEVIHSWKSFTSKEIGKLIGRPGTIWQEDYWDRFIRNAEHYQNCVHYIAQNPVKAGLCTCAEQWKWGSARFGRAK